MNYKLMLFTCITFSAQAMEHVPALYIFNDTSKSVTVSVTNLDSTKSIVQPIKEKTYAAAYNPASIQHLLVLFSQESKLLDIKSMTYYKDLVVQADQEKKNLCLTITNTNPITVSEISLCSKADISARLGLSTTAPAAQPATPPQAEPFVPRLFVKNNNWFWGGITANVLGLKEGKLQEIFGDKIVYPQQSVSLGELRTTNDYLLVTYTNDPHKKHILRILEAAVVEALQGKNDLHITISTDWAGTVYFHLDPAQAQKFVLPWQQQPSYLVQFYRRMVEFKQKLIGRLTARFADTAP